MSVFEPTRGRLQFNLGTLFIVFACLSLCFSLIAWRQKIGLLLSIVVVGIYFAGFGIRRRQIGLIFGGLVVASVIGVVFYVDMTGVRMWDGAFNLSFDVTILNNRSGTPVSGAEIVVESRQWEISAYKTDANGKAVFTQTFPCGGHDSYFGITRSSWDDIPLEWYGLRVKADGHAEVEVNLANAVGTKRWQMGDEHLPPIVIRVPTEEKANNGR